MKQDKYLRFKRSDIYKNAVLAEMEGRSFSFSGELDGKLSDKLVFFFNTSFAML